MHYQYSQDTPKARACAKYLGGRRGTSMPTSHAVGPICCCRPTSSRTTPSDRHPQYDQDAFPTGVPQISAVIRGARVLDPAPVRRHGRRTGADRADWSLYAYGGGADSDELVESAFIAGQLRRLHQLRDRLRHRGGRCHNAASFARWTRTPA